MGFTFRIVVALLAMFSLNSCGSLNEGLVGMLDLDTDFRLAFEVSTDINPDENDTPSPLFVRMYELKSDKLFAKADFIDLYERDVQLLGADMLAKHQLKRITPGEAVSYKYVLSEEASFVGLYAEFSQYQDASFKLVIPVVKNNVVSSKATVLIASNRMEQKLKARTERDAEAVEH